MISLTELGGSKWLAFAGLAAAFVLTFVLTALMKEKLPRDHGREYAVEGQRSAGKPRGAGVIFIPVFILTALLFASTGVETFLYLVLTAAAMLTGYLDDSAKRPWGEYKKGLLDLVIAILTAVVFLYFEPSEITLLWSGQTYALPPLLYGLGIVVLIWVSINVTNCSDGVDGLSGTLSSITLVTLSLIMLCRGEGEFAYLTLLLVAAIIAYLWFNATPSLLMMGDAGSRAIGFFIGIAALKTGCPLVYLPAALVLILDGGLGLIKVALLRFLKIPVFKKIHFPLHDHVRKEMKWSNTQTVFRFAIIQLVLCAAVLSLALP